MDFDSLPDDSAGSTQPTTPDKKQTEEPKSQTASSGVNFDDLQDDKEKYGSLGQQIGAGIEGVAQGVAGPVATGTELLLSKAGVPGLSAEDISGRAEANPWTHGIGEGVGLVGGLLSGTGELGLLSKGAEAVVGATGIAKEASTAAKIGSAAIKGFIENSGIQAGDEVSRWMLGQGDPEAPVASSLSHTGAAGLIGAGIGGGLGLTGKLVGTGFKALADSRAGNNVSQFLEDFGNRWNFNKENPNLVDSIHKELSDFFGSNSEVMDGVYGSKGLKAQAIEKLVPEMNESIANQNQKISNTLQNKINEMVVDPEAYPARLTKKLIVDANNWTKVATEPGATSNEVFNATQELKQKLQAYSKFDKVVGPLSPEKDFINVAKDLQHQLIGHLEDTGVWEQAGELQKGVNKAFTSFLPAQKDFLSKFTTKELGEATIDPGKLNTYVNQLGKPSAEIKQSMMKNYIDAAEKYRNQINDLYGRLGVESPLSPSSLNAVKETYSEITPGAEAANDLYHLGIGKLTSTIAGGIGGATAGHASQLPGGEVVGGLIGGYISNKLVPLLEKVIGRPIKNHAVPGVLKILGSNNPRSLAEALEHADNIVRGDSAIQSGVNSLFTGSKLSGQKAYDAMSDERNKEKIKDFVKKDGLNKQIQNSLQKTSTAPQIPPIPHFAEGGEVMKYQPERDAPKKTSTDDHLSSAYPEQSMVMSAAKGRVFNYLKSIRPQDNMPRLSFDKSYADPEHERTYNRAIDVAHKPLSILNHIQKGTLEPEHIQHMKQMFPEVHNQLSKKIIEKLASSQMSGDKMPPFHVRQGLSMFLGAPLDSNMTPSGIQAAQAVFSTQKATAQQGQAMQNKKNTSKLGEISKQHQTATQAAESRQITGKH